MAAGTSIAAELVSFTGNVLRGDKTEARLIKARILLSGHFYPELEKKVWSSRALDIPVALAVEFDALRYRDGRFRLGRFRWEAGGDYTACGESYHEKEKSKVTQISFTDETTGKYWEVNT